MLSLIITVIQGSRASIYIVRIQKLLSASSDETYSCISNIQSNTPIHFKRLKALL